jgi:cell division septal protein FtsQ
VSVQRPTTRRAKPAPEKGSRQKSFEWKSALPYVPAALKVLLAVSLGVLAFIGYRNAVAASFFKVRSVDVYGARRASREEIRAAVVRLSQAGVWKADLEAISGELKSLPWVRDAVVTRVLPAGLRVRVTEREPKVIMRNHDGRLVWADDEGVSLGAAVPGDEDFFFRGLDEATTETARRENRERMAVGLELKADWERAGLSKRVSEVDLADLRDVRVHLAGADSGIQVSLITLSDDLKRATRLKETGETQSPSQLFRDALQALDQKGRTRGTQCLSSIFMTPGRSPVLSYDPCGSGESAGVVDAHAQQTPAAVAAAPAAARRSAGDAATPKEVKKGEKKKEAARKPAESAKHAEAATRPRRVE